MAHNLYDERFVTRKPAWHKLGTVFGEDTKLTATQAMEMADMMFGIEKYPQVVKLEDGTELDTGSYAVVREPTSTDNKHEVLATVGKEWTPIQARDLGRMIDPISENFPVESAGALGKGEKIFLSLDASESKIAGEDHHLYWLVTDARDGTSGLTIAFTPVRVVCQNTLITGMRSSKVSINLKHNKSIQTDTEFYLDIFRDMAATKEQVVNAMNSLTNNVLDDNKIKTIINYAYRDASRPTKLKLSDGVTAEDVDAKAWSRILAHRKNELEEFDKRRTRKDAVKNVAYERLDIFNQEFGHFANTPWAVYNSVVEAEDYRRGHNGNNDAPASSTALFGDRAKTKARAFSKALEFAKV